MRCGSAKEEKEKEECDKAESRCSAQRLAQNHQAQTAAYRTKKERIQPQSETQTGGRGAGLMRKRLNLIVRLLLAWAFAHMVWIVASGLRDEPGQARTALVLGNKVEESGVPSERLQRRLKTAYDLFQFGHVKRIVVSGGTGQEGHDEAVVMRNTLVMFGVREPDIIVDSAGVDTMATARNYAALAAREDLGEPVIVSDYFHIERVRLALGKCGIQTAFHRSAEFDFHIKELWYVPREVIGYYAYLLFLRC